ncbi:MAG: chromate transporter [Treponema sp.]|jgi:chromate transporter|nr:chromate transporter [Treponema sp.]
MTEILYLFGTFFRIGLFAVGGGLATVPFLFEIADNSDWLTREAVGDMLAVAQSLPGAIGANLSSYTGFRYAGVGGAYAAALGLVMPSIIIIIIVAKMLKAFKESPVVQALFAGFRPAAAGLLSAAGFGAIALSLYNASWGLWFEFIRWKDACLFIVLFILIFKFKKHPILYIAAAGLAGAVLGL